MGSLVTRKDILKEANLLSTILSLGERGHFEVLNELKKLQIWILGGFGMLSFRPRTPTTLDG